MFKTVPSDDTVPATSAPIQDEFSAGYRYYMVALLALMSMMCTIDRALVSVLVEPIKNEFGLSDTQVGLLTGLIFAIAYSAAGIPVAMMLDRYRRTRLVALLLAIWSGLTALSGLATSWITLVLARAGVGAAESGASPAGVSLIADYFPKEKRSSAMAMFYTSTPVGTMLGFGLGGYLAANMGWRHVFFIFGIPGILLALVLLLTVKEPTRGQYDPIDPQAAQNRYRLIDAAKSLLEIRPLLWMLLGSVSVILSMAGLSAFMTPFLIRVHGMGVEEAGGIVAMIKGPTGIIGIIIGGFFADWLTRRSSAACMRGCAILISIATPLAIIGLFAGNWVMAAVFFAGYNFFNYTYYGATFATYMTFAPVQMRGALSAILLIATNLVGYGVGPTLAGTLSDVFAQAGYSDPLRWSLAVVAIFFAVAGLCFARASAQIRRMEREKAAD